MMRGSCHVKAHRKSILEIETAGAKALRWEKTLVRASVGLEQWFANLSMY